jgi:hypothetical protein
MAHHRRPARRDAALPARPRQQVRRLRHRRPRPPARGLQPGPQGSRPHRPRLGRLSRARSPTATLGDGAGTPALTGSRPSPGAQPPGTLLDRMQHHDKLKDDARQLAADIGDLAGRWDAAEEVNRNLGAEAQDAGERLMLLAGRRPPRPAAQTGAMQASCASSPPDSARHATTTTPWTSTRPAPPSTSSASSRPASPSSSGPWRPRSAGPRPTRRLAPGLPRRPQPVQAPPRNPPDIA